MSDEIEFKAVVRSRAIFDNLLRVLGPAERARLLAVHDVELQRAIDGVLDAVRAPKGAEHVSDHSAQAATECVQPVAPEVQERPAYVPTSLSASPPKSPVSLADVRPFNHNAPSYFCQDAADGGSVPSAIRAVLAAERWGLLTKQIVEGVNLLRPNTTEGLVSGALHAMCKRGELAREGFHKNYRYRLVPNVALARVGAPYGGVAP
jgi:hypothetical protein